MKHSSYDSSDSTEEDFRDFTFHPYASSSSNKQRHSSPPSKKAKKDDTPRPRKHYSCQPCRSKKIKCDRKSSCSNCVLHNVVCYWEDAQPVERSAQDELFVAKNELLRLRAVIEVLAQRARALSPDGMFAPDSIEAALANSSLGLSLSGAGTSTTTKPFSPPVVPHFATAPVSTSISAPTIFSPVPYGMQIPSVTSSPFFQDLTIKAASETSSSGVSSPSTEEEHSTNGNATLMFDATHPLDMSTPVSFDLGGFEENTVGNSNFWNGLFV